MNFRHRDGDVIVTDTMLFIRNGREETNYALCNLSWRKTYVKRKLGRTATRIATATILFLLLACLLVYTASSGLKPFSREDAISLACVGCLLVVFSRGIFALFLCGALVVASGAFLGQYVPAECVRLFERAHASAAIPVLLALLFFRRRIFDATAAVTKSGRHCLHLQRISERRGREYLIGWPLETLETILSACIGTDGVERIEWEDGTDGVRGGTASRGTDIRR